GPKRLLLVLEGGELRIAREEMLRSAVLSSTAAPKGIAASGFGFVLAIEGASYLILDGHPVPEAAGAPRLIANGNGPMLAVAAVEESALAPQLAARKGERVRLQDGCEAEITSFLLVSRVVPHFGTLEEWSGSSDPANPRPPASDAEVARSV